MKEISYSLTMPNINIFAWMKHYNLGKSKAFNMFYMFFPFILTNYSLNKKVAEEWKKGIINIGNLVGDSL